MLEILAQATQPTTAASAAAAPGFELSPVTLSPFVLLLMAVPVLLVGEQLVRKFNWLGKLNIPGAVVGGLATAFAILILQQTIWPGLAVNDQTSDVLWSWITLPQWGLEEVPARSVTAPLLFIFFTCIGLNASWQVAKTGGPTLLFYLLLASVLAVVQYAAGVLTAVGVGESPLMGAMCSGVSLMGGFGTATGFASEFENAGLAHALEIGLAAAAFGVIAGGLIAGPMANYLMRGKQSNNVDPTQISSPEADADGGWLSDIVQLDRQFFRTIIHLSLLFTCIKLGAFLGQWVQTEGTMLLQQLPGINKEAKLAFPVYLGSMIVAVVIRNIHDLVGLKFIRSTHVDLIGSFALAWMLAAYIIGLKLSVLLALAAPMLAILAMQVVVMVAFSVFVVYPLMGRSYESAAMSAGMLGFGLGATSNAVATMKAMARRYGPAPKAFLIVSVVGAFLIDFINSFLILGVLNLFRPLPGLVP